MVLNTGNNDSYQKEIESALKKIAREFPAFGEASWFLHQAGNWLCDFSAGKKKVYVLGTSLPNEIFLVFGTLPVRLLGGSRKLTEVSDSELPRDTDPVTRAAYGYLIAVMEERQADIDGDGTPETVIDAARADFGPHAYHARRYCLHYGNRLQPENL